MAPVHEKQNDNTRDIPPEIMSEIFALVWSGMVPIPCADHRYPWILGHIGSRWRKILWSTPSIWDSINIRCDSEECGSSDALLYILSKIPGPISLVALVQGRTGHAMSVILEHSDRFVELTIIGLNVTSFTSLFSLPTTAFPQLESLSLSPSGFYGHLPEFAGSPLKTAPKLRCINYRMRSSIYIPVLLLLPWAVIEDINVGTMHIPPEVVWDIFRSSPLLVSCRLRVHRRQKITATSQIILPTLEVLDLDVEDDFDWDCFLSPIMAPSLTYLTLTSLHLPCLPLVSLVIRSRCSLRILDVSDIDLNTQADNADVELFFDYLASIIDLCVPWPIPPSVFMKIQGGILLKLRKAELSVYPDGLGAFLDMIDSYKAFPGRCFGHFTIVCREGPGFEAQQDRYLAGYEVYSSIERLTIRVFEWNSFSEIKPPKNIDDAQ